MHFTWLVVCGLVCECTEGCSKVCTECRVSVEVVDHTQERSHGFLVWWEFHLIQKTGRKLQNHCVQMKLHWRYLRQMDKIHHIHQGLVSQQERTLESQPAHLVIFTCKDTIAPGSVDYQLKMLNFKLYVYIKARLVQNLTNLQYFTITIICIEYC